jgi:diguanylate cyclase (GGDEF)-like protein
MTLLSLVNFTLQSIILGLYAWAGSVPWPVVWLFFLVGTGQGAAFALVIWRGWNLRFRDPGLLMPQIVASMVVLLGFVALAPQVWILFLLAVMVAYNFVMMSFSARQFTVAWLLVGAGSAVALYAARGRLGHVGASDTSIAILWLFFFLVIRQLSAIGRQFSSLRSRLSQQNQQLAESLQRIQQLASHDDLTGVLNRRAFMQVLSDERARALRTAHPFCVALIDIDHFKSVNDRYGHLTGDAVLKEFCIAATSGIRTTDRLARFGGEEFILLLVPVMGAEAGFIATERVRLAVEAYGWGSIAPDLKLTMSAGVAAYAPGDTVESLIARADQALYAAKDAGRNRTVVG